mmetsp:Transcript_22724/g.65494  ORF Transcript_22724/g.65494 Transcript_22724/m.65494 type:complete len:270 (+) Transcript_22724:92-901(+)
MASNHTLPIAVLFLVVCGRVASLSSPTPFLFRRFAFASNGVSIRPETFYHVDGNKDNTKRTFSLRNVEGTGDCVFQAAALATATSMGLGGNNALLRVLALESRNVVAQVLEGGSTSGGNLYIEGKRLVTAQKLLNSASTDLGLEPDEYLRQLRLPGAEGGLYGGGPEITVLSNVLRRPITIYELHDEEIERANGQTGEDQPPLPMECRIKRVGVFGDMFKDPLLSIPDSAVLSGLQPGAYSWHLHILIVEASLNEKHACVLLPDYCDDP